MEPVSLQPEYLLSCPCSHYTEFNLLQFNSFFHPKHVEQKVCCKKYMQFAYYGIINVTENALVFNTVLTGRYVQTNFIQYQIDLCVSTKLSLQQVLFWYCEHHDNRLLLFSEIMLRTEMTVLVFWGTSTSQCSILLEMVNILRVSATEISELRTKTSFFYCMLDSEPLHHLSCSST